jgi:hypothetical protein
MIGTVSARQKLRSDGKSHGKGSTMSRLWVFRAFHAFRLVSETDVPFSESF